MGLPVFFNTLPVFFNTLPVFFNKMPLRVPTIQPMPPAPHKKISPLRGAG